ncbi:MAG: hypothetical protein CMF36_10205 [Leeuwenhoekiella sp.]|nr:hypothetical protein [Leeuwenhoekiella sp.]MBA81493.1 hypothetical protein [Leeuwenhoekiella sp.]|tara:strand:- start:21016 stop:21243 length:228 start_codon:yes stop_codon:yes gene_type:complete
MLSEFVASVSYITFSLLTNIFITMRDIIWLIVVILIIGWLVGFFGFGESVGSLIHILLVLAVIAILYKLATGRRL